MILAITLLHTITAGFSSSASVLNGRDMDNSGCTGDQCATLYLLTSTGEEISLRGTTTRTRQRGVVGARIVGTGCFTIYKGRDFSGPNLMVGGSRNMLQLADEGHSWTTVKSVKYSPRCRAQTAGAPRDVILAVGVVLALAALVGLVWRRYQRWKQHAQDLPKMEEMKSLKILDDGKDVKQEQQQYVD